MAIADVYDALVTERAYKSALPHAQAVEIIVGDRGRHFDPALTDVFVEIAASFETIHRTFSDGP
jgi:response regulator RpfG family c-di-GMP phosphodiesterase